MKVSLELLPVKMRLPLKFGAETIDSIKIAHVELEAYGAKGIGETPLSVAWSWPSERSFGEREDIMCDFCRFLAGKWQEPQQHPMTSGKVFLEGQDVFAQNEDQLAIFRRRQVGLIYQFYNLIPVLNVTENITLPVLMDGRKVNESRLQELLTILDLKDREKHLPNQLSGGQQQRVSIGRALMNSPAIVLADEPTGNLDSKNSQEIVELLKLSNKQYGQTLIVVTHDESIALQADRIISIEDGKIARDEVIR